MIGANRRLARAKSAMLHRVKQPGRRMHVPYVHTASICIKKKTRGSSAVLRCCAELGCAEPSRADLGVILYYMW